MEILVVGCGYTGGRLAARLVREGLPVAGTTRDPARAEELRAEGIRPLVLDLRAEGALETLARRSSASEGFTACFWLVPPVTPAAPEGVEAAARALELFRPPPGRFVYVSSTSVYGDRGGEWVDEDSTPNPDSEAGAARLAAERKVLAAGHGRGIQTCVARVAGIYGPDRTLAEALRSGRYQVVEESEAWSNRIHVDDLVEALMAMARRGRDGRIYNVCDDRPHRPAEYAGLTASLIDVEVPRITEEDARASYAPSRLARKLGSKRVSNRRLREELGVELRYPSFREGVPAALAARPATRRITPSVRPGSPPSPRPPRPPTPPPPSS